MDANLDEIEKEKRRKRKKVTATQAEIRKHLPECNNDSEVDDPDHDGSFIAPEDDDYKSVNNDHMRLASVVSELQREEAQLLSKNARLEKETTHLEEDYSALLHKRYALWHEQKAFTRWTKTTDCGIDFAVWQYTKAALSNRYTFMEDKDMVHNDLMDFISELIVDHFHVNTIDRATWWLTYGETVCRAIKDERNKQAEDITDIFTGEYFVNGLLVDRFRG